MSVLILLVLAMLSSVVVAFTSHAKSGIVTRANVVTRPVFVRFLSTGANEGEATIVDICKKKIMNALETNDVIVTGVCKAVFFVWYMSACPPVFNYASVSLRMSPQHVFVF